MMARNALGTVLVLALGLCSRGLSDTGPTLSSEIRPSVLPVPKAVKRVTIDGCLKPGEWADASRVPVNKIFRLAKFVSVPAWCYLKYDSGNLYTAFEVPYSGGLDLPAKGRDLNVFVGDEAEVILRKPGMEGVDGQYFHFGVAPNGAYAYSKGGWDDGTRDWSWNGGFRCAARRQRGTWYAEMAIPFADMGCTPETSKPWLVQLGLHRPIMAGLGGEFERWLSFSDGAESFRDPRGMASMHFQPDQTGIRIESMADLNTGRVNMGVSTPALAATTRVDVHHPGISVLSKEVPTGRKPVLIGGKDRNRGEGLCRIEAFRVGESSPIFLYNTLFHVKDPLVITPVCHSESSEFVIQADMSGMDDSLLSKLGRGRLHGAATLIYLKNGAEYGRSQFTPKTTDETIRMKFKE